MEKPILKITFKEPQIVWSEDGNYKSTFMISNSVFKMPFHFNINGFSVLKEQIKSIEFIQPNEL